MKLPMCTLAMVFSVSCGPSGVAPASAPAAPAAPAAAPALARPPAPAELAVPDEHKLAWVANAHGFQVYECAADASGSLAWKLHAPRAELFDASGAPVGSHFGGVDKGLPAGPYWQASDGSRIHGASPVSVPNPGSIPLLRLAATDPNGSGVLSRVAFVQRLATTGGVAPTTACTAGQTMDVAYTATYYFYTAP
jgi:hypothetical protein